jgi:hypothetical protein
MKEMIILFSHKLINPIVATIISLNFEVSMSHHQEYSHQIY